MAQHGAQPAELAEHLRRVLAEQQAHHEEQVEGLLLQHEQRLLSALVTQRPEDTASLLRASPQQAKSRTPIPPRAGAGLAAQDAPLRLHAPSEPPPEIRLDAAVPFKAKHAFGESGHTPSTCESSAARLEDVDEDSDRLRSVASLGGKNQEAFSVGHETTPKKGQVGTTWSFKHLPTGDKPKEVHNIMRDIDAAENHISRIQLVLNHRLFEFAVAILIIANGACIGVQTDMAMRNPDMPTPGAFPILEKIFLVAFTIELMTRIFGERSTFCSCQNKSFKWNLFDAAIVVSAWIDEAVSRIAEQETNVSAIRLFRIVRLVRILRVLRLMRFFRDLRVMVAGIISSLKSLAFAVLLLLIMMYMLAVCVLQIASEEQQYQKTGSGVLDEQEFADLCVFFDSLWRAIFTLYASILGGLDWSVAMEPLLNINPLLGLVFAGYVAFALLCVLNIVTGVFVENANKITANDEEAMLLKELSSRRQWIQEVCHLFEAHDDEQQGFITLERFRRQAEDVRVQAWFRKVGVDVESETIEGLFMLLDFDGDGVVNLDEFVNALQQFHGAARSIDMARIKYDLRMMKMRLVEVCNQASQSARCWTSVPQHAGADNVVDLASADSVSCSGGMFSQSQLFLGTAPATVPGATAE